MMSMKDSSKIFMNPEWKKPYSIKEQGYKSNILQKYLLEMKYESLLVVVRIDQIIKFMYTVIFESFWLTRINI